MSGSVATFYSYKGGGGRTLLLANVAWLLARWGRRVLCLDWDLEAPGLDRYLAPTAPPRDGVLDLVRGLGGSGNRVDWKSLPHEVAGPWTGKGRLDLIGAGRRGTDTFVEQVQTLNWQQLTAIADKIAPILRSRK